MIDEKYILNWSTFSDHLIEMLYQMKKSKELTDVTIVCDDMKQFHAHKTVLSACSSVFKNVFNTIPDQNTVIYLNGVKHQEMESILDFMYLGETAIDQNRINEFLNISKQLEVRNIGNNLETDEKNKTHDTTEISSTQKNTELGFEQTSIKNFNTEEVQLIPNSNMNTKVVNLNNSYTNKEVVQ